MNKRYESYREFFMEAFGDEPFSYQERLATAPFNHDLLSAPTGAGKTVAVLGLWLWRRLTAPHTVGRRLVYCLPMRTLVEQTLGTVEEALDRLGLADRITVHALMGGDASDAWDIHPEREAILVGTQDMLLSRALNRGYAMSRFRWPVHFGLLNNDCFWVFDEVQLMADGLATSAQLAAFREQFKTVGPTHSLWMSATIARDWLETVDFAPRVSALREIALSDDDRAIPNLAARLHATKRLAPAPIQCRTPLGLAAFAVERHVPGTQTLIVVNRVARAREVYEALRKTLAPERSKGKSAPSATAGPSGAPDLLLLHSRFRSAERKGWLPTLETAIEAGSPGRIIIATQVIEAGVDLSCRLLITDLAPYASLVQRFGRCNRRGEYTEAEVFCVDRPLTSKELKVADGPEPDAKTQAAIAAPYASEDLVTASEILASMESAAPADLPSHAAPYTPEHVLRRRDLVDLFDTTPDLSGFDLDVSRFVRGGDERDVAVAWRALGGKAPHRLDPRPTRDELCAVPIGEIVEFLKKKSVTAWGWNAVDGRWQRVATEQLRPGLEVVLDADAGGYARDRGWDPAIAGPVEPVSAKTNEASEALDDDPETYKRYLQSLEAHSREAGEKAAAIVSALSLDELEPFALVVIEAARHHDWGKVHRVFQHTLHEGMSPDDALRSVVLAKSTGGGRHARPHFRHELASALALLQRGASDLCVYLAACHHGKVRLSIRALPGEPGDDDPPTRDALFARGIYDGDVLDAIDLGDGTLESISLDLEPMLLGAAEDGRRSWLDRMLAVRDEIGVFRLAYLESLVRAADVQASRDPVDILEDAEEGDR